MSMLARMMKVVAVLLAVAVMIALALQVLLEKETEKTTRTSASDISPQPGTLENALARLNMMETRLCLLEESNQAVGALKPGALLSERHEQEVSSSAPSLAAPPSSLLVLAERGDGETLLRVLAAEEVDVFSNPPRTERGDTPLHVAASGGHLKAVMALLGAGAPVDVSGHRLRTPLHCAAAHGHLQVARRLLYAGAKVDAKDADGATALELATGKGFSQIVSLLLELGAHGDVKLTSLALSKGNKGLVEVFLEEGVSSDAGNEQGESLLMQAAKADHWDIVDLLLERGASPTKCKEDKESALVYASKGGQADAVRQLLRRGAASNAQQVKWALAVAQSAAVVWAFVDVVPEQVRGDAGGWGLLHAGSDGRLETLVALLEAGVDVNSEDGIKQNSLLLASENGHTQCVRELLERSADVSAKDNEASTPLHWASQGGHVECVRALLGAGASAAERNSDGKTPLDVAKTDEVRSALSGLEHHSFDL